MTIIDHAARAANDTTNTPEPSREPLFVRVGDRIKHVEFGLGTVTGTNNGLMKTLSFGVKFDNANFGEAVNVDPVKTHAQWQIVIEPQPPGPTLAVQILCAMNAAGGTIQPSDLHTKLPAFTPEQINDELAQLLSSVHVDRKRLGRGRVEWAITAEGQRLVEAAKPASVQEAAAPGPAVVEALAQDKGPDGETIESLRAKLLKAEHDLLLYKIRNDDLDHARREVERAKASVESAKAAVAHEKGKLSEALDAMVAIVAQPLGAQQKIPFEDEPGPKSSSDKTPEPVPAWQSLMPEVPPENIRVIGTTEGVGTQFPMAKDLAAIDPLSMNNANRKPTVVSICDTPYIVKTVWEAADGAKRAHCLRLHTVEEWQTQHQAKYGQRVDVSDQSAEAKTNRELGGEWCGLVVKHGRKKFVVGPHGDALQLVVDAAPADERRVEAAASAERSAAAVDDLAEDADDESEEE